jgi:long-chain fatty acid transport protein
MLKQFTMIIFVVIITGSLAFGSGFSIHEHGSKAASMGGAFIAQANDATAIYFNPAGITGLNGINVQLGLTVIQPEAYFQGPTDIDPNLYSPAEKETFLIPHFYATYQITDKLAAGLGFFVPFGLGSDWGQDWVGRELATNSDVQVLELNPVIAYKVLDNLSVALGFEYGIANVTLEKSAYLGYSSYALDDYAEFKLEGETTGMSFNLGIQYKPIKQMAIGLMYRHEMTLDFEDGDATFDRPSISPEVDGYLATRLPDTKGNATIVLPARMGVGIAYDFTDQLTAEFDYYRINWSSYDELTIETKKEINDTTKQTVIKNYEDQASFRIGLEYRLNEQIALRAGYLRDPHAVPDKYVEPDLPEGDRNLYSIGAGYKIAGFTFDAYYIYLTQDDREIKNSDVYIGDENLPEDQRVAFNGKYKSQGHLYGLTIGYSF